MKQAKNERSVEWAQLPVRCVRALVGITLCAVVVGCRGAHAETEDKPPVFQVASVEPSAASYEREFVGQVQAVRYTEIRSRVKGVIQSVDVDEGAPVQADQPMFVIRASELQQEQLKAFAATKVAEADLKRAQLELDNTRMLSEKNIASKAELALGTSKVDALTAKLSRAKAEHNQATINLNHTTVRAPFAGVVNRIPHRVGTMVGKDDVLTTLADASEVFVYFHVSERDYLEYAASKPEERPKTVSLRLVDGSVYSEQGVIDAVGNEVDKQTGNVTFRARFPNPAGLLKHGSSGKVVVRTDIRDALLVPQKSTFEVQGRLYVYTLDPENRARAKELVPKARLKDSFVVADGLGSEDRFVLEGIQKVKEGARLETRAVN